MHTTRRFTLIELLTVIAIIAVLMGILLPGIAIVQKKAKITQARGDMQSLLTAIKMYETTYGYLPVAAFTNDLVINDGGATNRYDQLIAFLSQTDMGAATLKSEGNLRGIRMLEVSRPGEYLDPWNHKYGVAIDANYTGKVAVAGFEGTPPVACTIRLASATGTQAYVCGLTPDVTSSVVIWSMGPDGAQSNTPGDATNEDNIYTVQTNQAKNGGNFAGHVLR